MRRAAILAIGDELMLGQALDTNSAWLAVDLAQQGVLATEHRTIADDRLQIAAAVRDLAASHDVLIITGGLGPTDDDLTRESLGDIMAPGEPLVTEDSVIQSLERRFARWGRRMAASNLRQAERPAPMRMMPNPHGTAPGLAGALGSCRIYALPGPPHEMKRMYMDHVRSDLAHVGAHPEAMRTATVHEFGLGESHAAECLGELTARDRPILVGITASESIVSAHLRVHDQNATKAHEFEQLIDRIERAWEPYAFGRDGESLAGAIGHGLLQAGKTLVTAESCSGGWLGKTIVDVPGSSRYYQGGWVTYANRMKIETLGVDAALLDGPEAPGAVSKPVAESMARGALDRSNASYALSITGVAGPAESPAKPAGCVFIGLAERVGSNRVVTRVRRFQYPGNRGVVRDRATKSALQMLRFAVREVPDDTALLWELLDDSPAEPSGIRRTGMSVTELVYVALGSNLGDRHAAIDAAIQHLRETPAVELQAVSRIIETAPVGPSGQGPYLNAVVALHTSLSPRDLLVVLQRIEAAIGRNRETETRWGPRIIDLDLLFFGDQIVRKPGLTVPHSRMHERAFVLTPLAEIAPHALHPGLGLTVESLRKRLVESDGVEYEHRAACSLESRDPRLRRPARGTD